MLTLRLTEMERFLPGETANHKWRSKFNRRLATECSVRCLRAGELSVSWKRAFGAKGLARHLRMT